MAGIFISYRRSDAGGWAGRFSDSLAAELGRATIFRDIDTIPPGVEFDAFITEAVGSCEVLIALIGPTWLTASDLGKRRLDNPNDFTRLEIATALRRKIRVVPALVGGAKMPEADDLPDDLKALARRNAYELTDRRWADDCRKLAEVLRPLVNQERARKFPLGNAAMTAVVVTLIALLALGGYGVKVWYDGRNSTPVRPAAGDGANQSLSGPPRDARTLRTGGTENPARTARSTPEPQPTEGVQAGGVEMFPWRATLSHAVDGLDGDKAKALVPKIGAAFPDIKPFIDAQYTGPVRAGDMDGSKAKAILKRLSVLTVRSQEDAFKWQTAIGGL